MSQETVVAMWRTADLHKTLPACQAARPPPLVPPPPPSLPPLPAAQEGAVASAAAVAEVWRVTGECGDSDCFQLKEVLKRTFIMCFINSFLDTGEVT